MAQIALSSGKYLMLLSALLYIILYLKNIKPARYALGVLLLFHFTGVALMAYRSHNTGILMLLGIGQLVLLAVSRLVMIKGCEDIAVPLRFLLSVGLLIQTRLAFAGGLKQLEMAAIGIVMMAVAAWLYPKLKGLNKLTWLYFIAALLLTALSNQTINGATNWMRIGDFSFQPSEIVKLLFILYLSSQLSHYKEKHALILSAVAVAILCGLLVYKRDLGSALIFFAIYILALYIETSKRKYIFYGLGASLAAGLPAYHFFPHVKVRITSWLDPWSDISGAGYQITQSLFAISNGSFFGAGITGGRPEKIPVVSTDFVFAAVIETLGLFMGLMVIFMIGKIFMAMIRTVLIAGNDFDFMLASGIAMALAMQSLLIIGGVIKMTPLTGVTLPFVSAGGTSIVMSLAMVGIVQGIHLKYTGNSAKRGKHHE